MDTFTKLIIFSVLAVFYAPTSSAYNYPPEWENLRVIDGELHIQKPGGGTSLMYPNIGISKQIPVNTSKGQFLVPIEKTFPVVPAKVGKVATRFVRSLPLIATGLAIYDTLCDLADICKSSPTDSNLVYMSQPTIYPTAGADFHSCAYTPYPSTVYATISGVKYQYITAVDSSPPCAGTVPAGYSRVTRCTTPALACGYYGLFRKIVTSYPPSSPVPLTEGNWTDAETKLNAKPQQTAEALYNSDAPVPVDASTHAAPVTQQTAQTSTQTKDAQGNITGTQTQTSTVTVTDNSTTSNVTYNVTENTTIANYNENGEVTGTQTSTTDNQPPKPPQQEETTISFDDVPPDQLEQEAPEFNLPAPVSWGEGTCPPDVDLGIYGLSISYAPACDTAEMLRPIFLLLASVSAMFIVAGVSRKD